MQSQPLLRQLGRGLVRLPRLRHRKLLRDPFLSERQLDQSPAEPRTTEPREHGRAARGLANPSPRYGRPRQAALSTLSLLNAPRGFRRGPQVRMPGPSRSRTTLNRGRATSASPVSSSRSPQRHGRRSGPVPSPFPLPSPRSARSPRPVPSLRSARSPRPVPSPRLTRSPSPDPFPRQRPLPPSLTARPSRRLALVSGLSHRRDRPRPGLVGSCGLSPRYPPHPRRPPLSPPHRWDRPPPVRPPRLPGWNPQRHRGKLCLRCPPHRHSPRPNRLFPRLPHPRLRRLRWLRRRLRRLRRLRPRLRRLRRPSQRR